MEIVGMISAGIVLVAVVFLLVYRIVPGTFRIVTGSTKELTIKRDNGVWGVYDDNNELAQDVKVFAGQTITWALSQEEIPLIRKIIEQREEQAREAARKRGEEGQVEEQTYIIELSLPSSVFVGFSKIIQHQALVVRRQTGDNDKVSVSHRVVLLAPGGAYPYAVEVDLDSGTFARGGSHTRVHLDPM